MAVVLLNSQILIKLKENGSLGMSVKAATILVFVVNCCAVVGSSLTGKLLGVRKACLVG